MCLTPAFQTVYLGHKQSIDSLTVHYQPERVSAKQSMSQFPLGWYPQVHSLPSSLKYFNREQLQNGGWYSAAQFVIPCQLNRLKACRSPNLGQNRPIETICVKLKFLQLNKVANKPWKCSR
mmetsp:Transcript_7026/g.12893  ORF Transcript_7026/g.12893 Transcript_7026/m.12893 type:complete len:121 (-) Transcript_7026:2047-2409(-)